MCTPMKHALALIAACCVILAFNGCAKMKGERIEFGHLFECTHMRGKVYYVTYKEDAALIRRQIEEAKKYECRKREDVGFLDFDPLCGNPNHAILELYLRPYFEGFLGWF